MFENKKQKKAFNCIKNGISLANRLNIAVRFLTLTTSELQKENIEYSPMYLNDNFRKLKQIIRRTKITDLIKFDYIKNSDLRRYYPNKQLNDKIIFDYFKVKTNEGNGVLHVVYKGDYIPYNFLVDCWNDLHNSWNINIKRINSDNRSAFRTAAYVVAQYLSNQSSSYQRSSQSWLWTIRGYYKRFCEFIAYCKVKYYYNPVKQRFYKNRVEVNVFEEWLQLLLHLLKPPDRTKQIKLDIC